MNNLQKRYNRRKMTPKFFLAIFIVSVIIFTPAEILLAQNSTPPPRAPQSVEELLEFRKQILDLFGIPHDAPITIFDLMKGNINGVPLPETGIPKVDRGPLQDLKLVINQKNLQPGKEVQAVAVSFTTDLQKATISWYHNNKRVLSGIGEATYIFPLGSIGSTETIRVVVTAATGETKEVTQTIRPAKVHFYWYTDSYTPTWYRGKALAGPGSELTIVAFPDIRIGQVKINTADLLYYWSINNGAFKTDPTISGRGKNTYKLKLSTVQDASYKIRLQVKDSGSRVIHEETFSFTPTAPKILFYQVDPLYGVVVARSIERESVSGGTNIHLKAEPYYVGKSNISKFQYDWKLNGRPISLKGNTSRELRFLTEEGSIGQQVISLFYKNPMSILESGNAQLQLNVTQ